MRMTVYYRREFWWSRSIRLRVVRSLSNQKSFKGLQIVRFRPTLILPQSSEANFYTTELRFTFNCRIMSEVGVFVPLFHSKLPCVPDPMFPQFLICSLFQLIHLLTTSPHCLHQHLIVPTFPKTGWCFLVPYDIFNLFPWSSNTQGDPQ